MKRCYNNQLINLFANTYSNVPSKEITKHQVLAGLKGRITCTNSNRSPQHADSSRELVSTVATRQIRFLRHILRKEKLEELVLTGRIEGKRARGR